MDNEIKWLGRTAYNRLIFLDKFFDDEGVGEEAQALFMFLWRVQRHSPGNPAYPKITKENIRAFLHESVADFY